MITIPRKLKTVLMIALLGLLCWLSPGLRSPASDSARLEARINRLESSLGRLQTQVSRMQSQLSLPQQPTTPPLPAIPPSPYAADPSIEEQFDNLATLTIELKLEVQELQERVAQLEASRS
jgi:small-conductance mechanosensitive channel